MRILAEPAVNQETVARLLLYRFLAQCYTYPEPAFCQTLRQREVWDQLSAAGQTPSRGGTDQSIMDLQAYVGFYNGGDEKLLTDLQIEYTYLFINAVPHVPAPPYESAYTGAGLLMGEPVSQVLKAYREAGLIMHDDYDALPDHIAAELEFVSYLIQQEATAAQQAPEEAEAWRTRQRDFLAEHLLRWGPPFLKRVMEGARRPFYIQVAKLTDALFHSEKRRFRLT
jgi:DMSO reductase family type II enzyme chaperone